jgi:hypothetical protein
MYLCYGKFCTEKHTTNLLAYIRKSGRGGRGKEIHENAGSENPPNCALVRLSWAEDFEQAKNLFLPLRQWNGGIVMSLLNKCTILLNRTERRHGSTRIPGHAFLA